MPLLETVGRRPGLLGKSTRVLCGWCPSTMTVGLSSGSSSILDAPLQFRLLWPGLVDRGETLNSPIRSSM